jgi:N-acetylneuraminic acid mutarotase
MGFSGVSPSARYAASMVFVPAERKVYLFGGRYEGLFGTAYRNDLWTFDYAAKKWSPVRTHRRPPARGNTHLVYDPDHQQLILFGGIARERMGDTWCYNLVACTWRETTPAVSPPPRSDAGMAYDPENHVAILFSGYGLEGSRDLYADTWAYNPETNTWVEMHPTASPPIMYGQTLIYDSVRRQALLWSGHASIYQAGQVTSHWYEDNLWRYDYPRNTWEKLPYAVKPPPRYWGSAVFDADVGVALIFGGKGHQEYLSDTWITDPERTRWTRIDTAGAPTPRVNPAMAYDTTHHIAILFGGLTEDFADLRDTWVFEMGDTEGLWTKVTP